MNKQSWREKIWRELRDRRRVQGDPSGKIPNFLAAAEAAVHLSHHPAWKAAKVVKVNPDKAQAPVRAKAIQAGKTLVMPAPRLAKSKKCFYLIEPGEARRPAENEATHQWIRRAGNAVHPANVPHVDLAVVGSVAVNRFGQRLGKGGGYADLELAIGFQAGFINVDTLVATTVDEIQVVDDHLPQQRHDMIVDIIATQKGRLDASSLTKSLTPLLREMLDDDQLEAMPVLKDFLDS